MAWKPKYLIVVDVLQFTLSYIVKYYTARQLVWIFSVFFFCVSVDVIVSFKSRKIV